MSEPTWLRIPLDQRELTVDDVRARCVNLPPARRRHLGHDVAEPRDAATLVPIVDDGGRAAVVLTRRASTMTYHRGDWVFPGGRFDPAHDATLADTARREAREELGVPEARVEILGELDSHGPIVTGFVIHPFVAAFDAHTPLVPDRREVDEILIVPLAALMADGVYREGGPAPAHDPGPSAAAHFRPLPAGELPGLRFFRLRDGEDLWGTQAEILRNLLEHLVA